MRSIHQPWPVGFSEQAVSLGAFVQSPGFCGPDPEWGLWAEQRYTYYMQKTHEKNMIRVAVERSKSRNARVTVVYVTLT